MRALASLQGVGSIFSNIVEFLPRQQLLPGPLQLTQPHGRNNEFSIGQGNAVMLVPSQDM